LNNTYAVRIVLRVDLPHSQPAMAERGKANRLHFVAFRDPSTRGTGAGAMAESQARSHAARVAHLRRKKTRGNKVLRWINEHPSSSSSEDEPAPTNEIQALIHKRPISPMSPLSQHKADPFDSWGTGRLPTYLHSCLEYGELTHLTWCQHAQF